MLGYYGQQVSAVEINNTFYRCRGERGARVGGAVRRRSPLPSRRASASALRALKEDSASLVDSPQEHRDTRDWGPILFQLPTNLKRMCAVPSFSPLRRQTSSSNPSRWSEPTRI